jgi:WD repeat-containing protein 35
LERRGSLALLFIGTLLNQAQRLLYESDYIGALKASIRLCEYEKEIDPKKLYSLMVISAYYAENYQQCSRAFVKLKNLPSLSYREKKAFEQYAAHIFLEHPPRPPANMEI